MIKKQLSTLITLCSLCFIGCNSTHSNKKNLVEDDNISLEVTLERNMSSPYPLDIVYKLTNLSDKTVFYDNLAVPFKKTSQDIFKVIEDDITIRYKGFTFFIDEPAFDILAPGETFSASVPLDEIYEVSKGTHNYQISLSNNTILVKIDNIDNPQHMNNIKSNTLEFEATIQTIREIKP